MSDDGFLLGIFTLDVDLFWGLKSCFLPLPSVKVSSLDYLDFGLEPDHGLFPFLLLLMDGDS